MASRSQKISTIWWPAEMKARENSCPANHVTSTMKANDIGVKAQQKEAIWLAEANHQLNDQ